MQQQSDQTVDTIVAPATPPGRGGVGIVRISGPQCRTIAESILMQVPSPRIATYVPFLDEAHVTIDEGIALFFPAPHSFTGEDVLELQGHGGPVVLDRMVKRAVQLGARLARAGEFSERAFLNQKIDLTQAEAIADLINASSEQAAKSAIRSLQGAFSQHIQQLLQQLIQLRMMVEAAIDFPEEEIDFLADPAIATQCQQLLEKIEHVFQSAKQGSLLQEGLTLVIAGKPNAGKSSLLNCLAGKETAIVTSIAGTTRDILRELIHIGGLPLHIIDTAGLRESADVVEQEGIRRAWQAIENADLVLYMVDGQTAQSLEPQQLDPAFFAKLSNRLPVIMIKNKIDLLNEPAGIDDAGGYTIVHISAKQQIGIDELKQYLMSYAGYHAGSEGTFIARRRHLAALTKARESIAKGLATLQTTQAGELLAEDLRQAQQALAEITGEYSSDDLLGAIFASFCIGK